MSGNYDLRQRDTKSKAQETVNKCKKTGVLEKIEEAQETCTSYCMPCLVSHNPLPDNPSRLQKFKHALMLPLHGKLATYVQFTVVCIQLWIILYTLVHQQALPGGNLYSLLIMFIGCVVGGYFITLIRLPPLLGILVIGILLRNVPGINGIGENIDKKWSRALRKIALTVLLTRAGLGLDIVKLRRLSWAVLRLAFLPCASEIITVGITSHFIFGFPWTWSLMVGCILGAVSPAVTVPILVNLQDRQYGVDKGIPTMLIAAGGLDNVLCVTGFSVVIDVIFSEGDLVVTVLKGPLGVFVGIVYGFVTGIILWYIPSESETKKIFYRSLILLGFGMIAMFGSSEIKLASAGPLGCLTTAAVAGYKWRQRCKEGEPDEISGIIAVSWLVEQHFLFGLIGAAVDISRIQSSTAGLSVLTVVIGLVIRSIVDFTVTLRTGFNIKERVFISLTWLSKATLQAAGGGLPLDKVTDTDNPDASNLKYATDILTLSVLSILICAPTGATLMAILGPKFLVKGYVAEESIEEPSTVNDSGQNTYVQTFVESNEIKKTVEQPHKFEQYPVLLHENEDIDTDKAVTFDISRSSHLAIILPNPEKRNIEKITYSNPLSVENNNACCNKTENDNATIWTQKNVAPVHESSNTDFNTKEIAII